MSLIENIYNDTYETVYKDLQNKKQKLSKLDVNGLLNSLYAHLGNSMSGKSEIQNAILNATIAAHEAFLSEYK